MYVNIRSQHGTTQVFHDQWQNSLVIRPRNGRELRVPDSYWVVAQDHATVFTKGAVNIIACANSWVNPSGGTRVIALAGANVFALEGSYVDARYGSEITALDGSFVQGRKGARVIARLGARVVAHEGVDLTTMGGAQIISAGGKHARSFSLNHRMFGR
jgi:hypothetical protein